MKVNFQKLFKTIVITKFLFIDCYLFCFLFVCLNLVMLFLRLINLLYAAKAPRKSFRKEFLESKDTRLVSDNDKFMMRTLMMLNKVCTLMYEEPESLSCYSKKVEECIVNLMKKLEQTTKSKKRLEKEKELVESIQGKFKATYENLAANMIMKMDEKDLMECNKFIKFCLEELKHFKFIRTKIKNTQKKRRLQSVTYYIDPMELKTNAKIKMMELIRRYKQKQAAKDQCVCT